MILPALLAVAPGMLPAQDEAAARAATDRCDAFFAALGKSMRLTPQSSLQNWVRIQEACRDLGAVMENDALPVDVRLRARYTLAFGLQVIGLPDAAAANDLIVTRGATDKRLAADAGDDLGQALEMAGNYSAAADVRRHVIEAAGKGSAMQYNNLALVLLKAGAYDECLHYLEKVNPNGDNTHTRIFSARAYGFSKHYDRARDELKKSCDGGEPEACAMLSAMKSAGSDTTFWTQELERRQAAWRPENRFDPAICLADDSIPNFSDTTLFRSHFAMINWFDEIFGLYREDPEHDMRPVYPGALPHGHVGFVLVGGVPLVMVAAAAGGDVTLDSVRVYVRAIHGQSEWEAKIPIRTRALVARFDRESVIAIVHTDWLEEMLRKRFPNYSWEAL